MLPALKGTERLSERIHLCSAINAYRCQKDHNGDGSEQRYARTCQCSFCKITAHHTGRNVKHLALCNLTQHAQLTGIQSHVKGKADAKCEIYDGKICTYIEHRHMGQKLGKSCHG